MCVLPLWQAPGQLVCIQKLIYVSQQSCKVNIIISQMWKFKLRERLNDLNLDFIDFKTCVLVLLNNNHHKNNIKKQS